MSSRALAGFRLAAAQNADSAFKDYLKNIFIINLLPYFFGYQTEI